MTRLVPIVLVCAGLWASNAWLAPSDGPHAVSSIAAPNQVSHAPNDDRDARMAWWRDARFGMFIHWGLYAVPAGEYNGKRSKGSANGSWRGRISRAPTTKNSHRISIPLSSTPRHGSGSPKPPA